MQLVQLLLVNTSSYCQRTFIRQHAVQSLTLFFRLHSSVAKRKKRKLKQNLGMLQNVYILRTVEYGVWLCSLNWKGKTEMSTTVDWWRWLTVCDLMQMYGVSHCKCSINGRGLSFTCIKILERMEHDFNWVRFELPVQQDKSALNVLPKKVWITVYKHHKNILMLPQGWISKPIHPYCGVPGSPCLS